MNNGVGLKSLQGRLEDPCFEIIPLKGIEKKLGGLPPESDVAITCSPDKGIPATLDLTRRLMNSGFTLIPHIAARMVEDEAHLHDILGQLDELGVHRIFVVGGDAEQPAGQFDSSLQLLQLMSTLDHSIDVVGIGAYPEGHPLIDDPILLKFLQEKQPFAAYMVTQMCFDPEAIVDWLRRIRAEGVDLPVHIGVPGVGERAKLLRVALKIGVGQSARFLRSNLGLVGRMIKPGGYTPEALLLAMAPYLNAPSYNIEGVHFYTFNQIESTEKWRTEMLTRLSCGMDPGP